MEFLHYLIIFLASLVSRPCYPSPCGPNSQCKEINEQAVCSCVLGFIGSPPTCRPECITSSECPLNEACSNQKCVDPCPGTCGIDSLCHIINHNPVCTCSNKYTGDPFVRCHPQRESSLAIKRFTTPSIFMIYSAVEEPVVTPTDPCQPSPCGSYSECKNIENTPSCTCLPNYIGSPPNCRPECVNNAECSHNLACITQKCKDPCPGACGINAECRVISHTPNCFCINGYIGNPFVQCEFEISKSLQFVFLKTLPDILHNHKDSSFPA